MSYRDDRDADQARIAALEQELSQTRDKLTALESRHTHALALANQAALIQGSPQTGVTRWFGPTIIRFVRRFAGAFPTDRFEELVERLREETHDPGRSELLRSSLTWFASRDKGNGPYRIVTVTVRDGATTLTVTDRLGGLMGAIYGGVGGGVGGGGLSVPIMASAAVPYLAPVFILGWLGGVFLGARAIYKRAATRRAVALQQLFDVLVDDIEQALRGGSAK
jgi:hypothetical protein